MRLPLSAKILAWFFLNLAVLAAVFLLLFNAQFRFDLDWVLETSAGQRVAAMRALIVGELNTTPPDDWGGVLARYSEAYGMRLALFEPDGRLLIGSITALPEAVRERMISPRLAGAGKRAPRRDVPPRAFMRTSHPARYWLAQRARIDNPQTGPLQVLLVARADSVSMGGLILDPVPWVALAAGTVIFSVLFWLPLLHGITRSIRQMQATTRQIAEGRFDVRLATRRRDELGALADGINQMAARLNGFVQGQKRFLGDIAHELCSPLAKLQMVLGILEQRAAGAAGVAEHVRSAGEKAGQIAGLVNELLAFSRASFGASAVHLGPVPVRQAVEEAVAREGAEGVEIAIAEELAAHADADLLVRAVGNLLRNALRHGAAPVGVAAAREDGLVVIRVSDHGTGVAEEELPKLFDAFYRVDGSRARETGGVGLGLTIVKTCVESCNGTVSARNRRPRGLEVVLRLPLAQKPLASPAPSV